MKLNYFPDTDSLYIDLSQRPTVESQEVSEGGSTPCRCVAPTELYALNDSTYYVATACALALRLRLKSPLSDVTFNDSTSYVATAGVLLRDISKILFPDNSVNVPVIK